MKNLLILFITAALITALIPMRGMKAISINRGEMWQEASLIAPFDIPISKTIYEIEQDRAALVAAYEPLFRIDTAGISKLTGDSVLRKILSQGIMSETEWERYKNKNIRVVCGNTLTTRPVQTILTPQKTLEKLKALGKFHSQLKPNLTYDEPLNIKARQDYLSNVSATRGVIRAGETLISKGQAIDEPTELLLNSYVLEYEKRLGHGYTLFWVILGRFLIIISILALNVIFFQQFSRYYLGNNPRSILFIFLLYVLMAALVSLASRTSIVNPYIVPLPVVAIYLLTFFNMRVAILGNITVAILGALFVRQPFPFFLINFMGGMAAIFMLRHLYHRTSFFKAIGVVFAIELVLLLCLSLLAEASVGWQFVYNSIFLLIGIFLTLGFYQAIYLIERLFGFVSDLTLLELSDTNQSLLLKLAQEAPGTFQHSVQVANLAESAAKVVGAAPLLTRCGALYHDIGKMNNPFYFVENQTGVFNPHNDLSPQASAEIIRRHVSDGIERARAAKIPQQVIDFIERHHGNSLIYYFYAKAKESGLDVVEDDFRYPGLNPESKEVSICMMADAVEAASRSLASYEKVPLEELVERVINTQMSEGLFANSQLTFAEVAQIKETFKSKLNTIYHGRIAYPSREK